jgi:hypothetical protein
MVRGFEDLSSHLTDIKDMVIDQNEWYEEMFYYGDSQANMSGYGDTNEDMPTDSDVSDSRIETGFLAGLRNGNLRQRKSSFRQMDQSPHSSFHDQSKDTIPGRKEIKCSGFSRMKTLLVEANQGPSLRKLSNSIEFPASGSLNDLDPPPKSIGEKLKTYNQEPKLRLGGPSMKRESPDWDDMNGEYGPVSDLIKSFQISEDPMHISKDQEFSSSKGIFWSKPLGSRKFMTPEGEGMYPIDEHEDEQ